MPGDQPAICVIIAAWNAQNTVGRAVRSALAQAEVREVIVVDDASSDETGSAALSACDGTGRLKLVTQPENRGPSAARNRAIAESTAPFIAILDSDDFLLPGRFSQLLEVGGWDAIFDNIAFIGESRVSQFSPDEVRRVGAAPEPMGLPAFIRGNISDRGKPRAELGFIKPLFRRAFLAEHGLRYDEQLRLGEDYILYARMLALGARFIKARCCGYVAVERARSLSGSHRTEDLRALLLADRALLALPGLTREERLMFREHIGQLAGKLHYREVLDVRKAQGRPAALGFALKRPLEIAGLARSVWHDKRRSAHQPEVASGVRYLFP